MPLVFGGLNAYRKNLIYSKSDFRADDWQPQPVPAQLTTAKLIPIVCTQSITDPTTLVALYRHRWAAQENVIKDFLLPLGLDINHGYAKQQVDNSEFRRQYDAFQNKAQRLDRWRKSALRRMERAQRRHQRLDKTLKDFIKVQYDPLNTEYRSLNAGKTGYYQRRRELDDVRRGLDAVRRGLDAEIEQQQQTLQLTRAEMDDEFVKAKRYAQQQCQVQRDLLDLEDQVCAMFELDNRKDQLMSVFNIVLTNLIMWTRDIFFPDTYARATWKTLQPFFRLPGRIETIAMTCIVTLRPFNDLALNRDLIHLCQNVNDAQLKLPNGLVLQFQVMDYD